MQLPIWLKTIYLAVVAGLVIGCNSEPVVIEQGSQGLGDSVVSQNGQNVWPPEGPGCAQLVACCDAAAASSSTIALGCQLTVAAHPGDCPGALEATRALVREQGMSLPAQCTTQ